MAEIKTTATMIIHEVIEEMCLNYCKYPKEWDEEKMVSFVKVRFAATVLLIDCR